jgi:hypothetical protein
MRHEFNLLSRGWGKYIVECGSLLSAWIPMVVLQWLDVPWLKMALSVPDQLD